MEPDSGGNSRGRRLSHPTGEAGRGEEGPLGGQVFDVLGKVQFEGKPLRELLLEAIRYGERPEVQARLNQVVRNAFDETRVQDLLSESALAQDVMDTRQVLKIREEMEQAEARKLQPHYIESFFIEAFRRLGGRVTEREPRRYQVSHVPAQVRDRDRMIGLGEPVLQRYERITFEKSEDRDGRASTGWDTILSALVAAGFQIVGTWPMRTERSGRPNALSANSLASSVVLVCRMRPHNSYVATRREFVNALRSELPDALRQMQTGNIAPVDLAQAAIGRV